MWIILVVVLWFALIVLDKWLKRPPARVKDAQTFLEWHAHPDRWVIHTLDGQQYLEAHHSGALSLVTLPSGPAVYVFDRSGRLVAWTGDVGDDGRFQAAWRQTWPDEFISLDAAMQWLGSQSAPPPATTQAAGAQAE